MKRLQIGTGTTTTTMTTMCMQAHRGYFRM